MLNHDVAESRNLSYLVASNHNSETRGIRLSTPGVQKTHRIPYEYLPYGRVSNVILWSFA